MALKILRKIASEIQTSEICTVMANKTSPT